MQSKVLAKIEQIARYRVLGKKDSWIAQVIGMSCGGLSRILATDEYRQIEASVRQQLIGKMDNALEQQRVQIMRQQLADAVPDALKFIIDTCRQGQDMRARMAAAKEVLDRDPQRLFSKGSTNREDTTQSPSNLPPEFLATAQSESDKAVDILARVTKPAEA